MSVWLRLMMFQAITSAYVPMHLSRRQDSLPDLQPLLSSLVKPNVPTLLSTAPKDDTLSVNSTIKSPWPEAVTVFGKRNEEDLAKRLVNTSPCTNSEVSQRINKDLKYLKTTLRVVIKDLTSSNPVWRALMAPEQRDNPLIMDRILSQMKLLYQIIGKDSTQLNVSCDLDSPLCISLSSSAYYSPPTATINICRPYANVGDMGKMYCIPDIAMGIYESSCMSPGRFCFAVAYPQKARLLFHEIIHAYFSTLENTQ